MKKIILMIALAFVVSGCGVQSNDDTKYQPPKKQQSTKPQTAQVPARTGNDVAINGVERGSLTPAATTDYVQSGGTAPITSRQTGEEEAFEELCAGKIDLVDSSRPISQKEWQVCHSGGLNVVQFQVASEAVVLAMRAETDTGADCLTVKNTRDMYRAGSPVYNWRQLEYDDVPLGVGGPGIGGNGFSFFGQYILESAEPSMLDFRSDYRAFATDQGLRRYVVGADEDMFLVNRQASDRSTFASRRTDLQDARMSLKLANKELKNAVRDRKRGIRDGRPRVQQRKDQVRQDKAYTKQARARDYLQEAKNNYASAQQLLAKSTAATKRRAALLGRVGYFRFSYYELYEDQLRPLEIDRDGGKRDCIFPSQQTVTEGSYPLSRQLLITTTTQALSRKPVKEYLENYLDNSQELAIRLRMVPLPDSVVADEKKMLAGKPRLVEYKVKKPKKETAEDIRPAR